MSESNMNYENGSACACLLHDRIVIFTPLEGEILAEHDGGHNGLDDNIPDLEDRARGLILDLDREVAEIQIGE